MEGPPRAAFSFWSQAVPANVCCWPLSTCAPKMADGRFRGKAELSSQQRSNSGSLAKLTAKRRASSRRKVLRKIRNPKRGAASQRLGPKAGVVRRGPEDALPRQNRSTLPTDIPPRFEVKVTARGRRQCSPRVTTVDEGRNLWTLGPHSLDQESKQDHAQKLRWTDHR